VSDRLPALFSVVIAILNAERVRVFEHKPGGLKADAVLRSILPVLPFVLLKAHDRIAVTTRSAGQSEHCGQVAHYCAPNPEWA